MRVEGKVDTIFCYALLRIQHPIKVMYLKYVLFKTQMNLVLLLTFADWPDRAVLAFFFHIIMGQKIQNWSFYT